MNCNHLETKETLLPASNKHYSKINCLICGKFLAFSKNPKTTERFNEKNKTINKLLAISHNLSLSNWDINFLESIKSTRMISPKQEIYYQKIVSNFE